MSAGTGWDQSLALYEHHTRGLAAIDAARELLAEQHECALWEVLEAPAPDAAALERKLEIAFAPDAPIEGILDRKRARSLADWRRLAGL